MKLRILCAALVAAGCCVALAAPAMAQTTTTQPAQQQAQPATAPASDHAATAKVAAKHKDPRFGTRMCVRDTGSLLKPAKGQCLPVNGNTYTRQDLLRTGQTNIARALQELDPSVSVGH